MTEPTMPTGQPPSVPPVSWGPAPTTSSGRFNWGDFFSFRYMVTPVLIRVIYVVGAVLVTLGAIAPLATANGAAGLVFAILVFLVGNLYWRVIMELFMVFFGMHESLRAIERQGRR